MVKRQGVVYAGLTRSRSRQERKRRSGGGQGGAGNTRVGRWVWAEVLSAGSRWVNGQQAVAWCTQASMREAGEESMKAGVPTSPDARQPWFTVHSTAFEFFSAFLTCSLRASAKINFDQIYISTINIFVAMTIITSWYSTYSGSRGGPNQSVMNTRRLVPEDYTV